MITEMFKVELGGSVHLQSGPNKCMMHYNFDIEISG